MPILKKKSEYVYAELETDLRDQILRGVLKPDECILSENALCERYHVSRRSARKALDNLVKQGMLYRRAGKGTYVSPDFDQKIDRPAISFIVPEINDLFISEVSLGVQQAATDDCFLILQTSGGSSATENANIEWLLHNRIAGAVIFPNWGRANIDALYKLKRAKIPFVLVDRYLQDFDSDCVLVDNIGGAKSAVRHLLSRGHKRIAHLFGTEGTANQDRLMGYMEALAEANLVYRPDYVLRIPADGRANATDRFEPDRHFGYLNMKRLLSLPEPPTAVFAGNDYQAMGALQAIEEAGLRVPGEMAVVGFDDLKVSALLETPLTTIAQPKADIGRRAVELLLRRIRGEGNGKTERIVLPTKLVVRKSS
jgi:DNA-binding LacI/PurR family transcriptional regulator